VGLLAHAYVPLSELSGAWDAQPLVLVAAAASLALFAQAFVRLRLRGRADLAPASRALLFASGVAIGVLAVSSPLDAAADDYLLMDVVPLLLVLALRGPLTFFLLPAPALRVVASWSGLRAVLAFLLVPAVTLTVWAVVVYAWHVPAAYDATLSRPWLHDLEHVLFVVVGLLVWIQLVDPAQHHRLTRGGRVLFAIGVLALAHPVMDVLVFSDSALYATYADQPLRLLGLSPLTDQKVAGLIMFVEQTATLGACIGILLWPYLRARRGRLEEVRTA
jgi:putative membrane protein